jgi:hypothetical protein
LALIEDTGSSSLRSGKVIFEKKPNEYSGHPVLPGKYISHHPTQGFAMPLLSARSACFMLFVILIALTAGCSSLAPIHPPGERIGSCEGRLRLRSSGEQVSFRLDLYSSE